MVNEYISMTRRFGEIARGTDFPMIDPEHSPTSIHPNGLSLQANWQVAARMHTSNLNLLALCMRDREGCQRGSKPR